MDEFLEEIAQKRREKHKADLKLLGERIKEARAEAQRLTERFRELDGQLKRVVLFGSIAENNVKNLKFDIDLAIVCKEYYRLVSEGLDSTFKVDVVDINRLPAHIRKRVDDYGEVLYER